MKVATVLVAGERRVGQIAKDGTSIAPFELALSETRDGILALIRRNSAGLPPTPVPPSRVTIEAPIPLPRRSIFRVGKNCSKRAHEFARSGFGFDPPRYLGGDMVRIEIGSIGLLENEPAERAP